MSVPTRVLPFRALMYDTGVAGPLGGVLAPPYDVIGPEERDRLAAAAPHNAVHLELPDIPYDEVRGLVDDWTAAGALARADAPIVVAWTQTFTLPDGSRHERRTLLATVGVEPYAARVVRPHERTHAGPKEDRLRLIRATRMNISPVFGLYPDADGAVWAAAGVSGPPDGEATDPDGTVSRIWRVADPVRLAAITAEMASRWILIADGHHRYETAVDYRAERPDGGADHVLMGLTALDDPGLVVLPTHRMLGSWPDGAAADFSATPTDGLLALERALAEAPSDAPAFGLVRPGGAVLLTRAGRPGDSPGARLDTAVLETEILIPAFGRDQAGLAHDGDVWYVKDAKAAWDLVDSGRAAAAVLMRPIAKAQVAEVAEAGETMPQKSTYFFPKLLTGVAFNLLDRP